MEYSDNKDKIIFNGDTTIVYGECRLDEALVKKLVKEFGALYFESDGINYTNTLHVRGVAHRDEKDVYDKTIGLKVASRKAELKARVKTFKNLYKVYKKLVELEQLIDDELIKENRRIYQVHEELEEMRKK